MRLSRNLRLRRSLVYIGCALVIVPWFLWVFGTTNCKYQQDPHQHELQHIVKRIYTDGVLDPLNEYTIIPNLVTPYDWESGKEAIDITICTHSTSDNLHYLKEMSMRWGGPISVTVLSYGAAVKNALYDMLLLHMCHGGIRKFVSFHLIMPVSHPPEEVYDILNISLSCKALDYNDEYAPPKNFKDLDHPYPLNTMRNVAIVYSKTDYIFMVDIDIMPSKNLAQNFQAFIKSPRRVSENEHIAYVIPVFESKTKNSNLETKEDLIKEYKNGNVRIYYVDDCPECQVTTDYPRWMSIPSTPEPEVLYNAIRTYVWEPFYIAGKRHLPLYDGRFKRYGFNRISQICEAHMAGFEFLVMNNLFIVHDGFKFQGRFHPSRYRELQSNRELFAKFKREMRVKYSSASRFC